MIITEKHSEKWQVPKKELILTKFWTYTLLFSVFKNTDDSNRKSSIRDFWLSTHGSTGSAKYRTSNLSTTTCSEDIVLCDTNSLETQDKRSFKKRWWLIVHLVCYATRSLIIISRRPLKDRFEYQISLCLLNGSSIYKIIPIIFTIL